MLLNLESLFSGAISSLDLHYTFDFSDVEDHGTYPFTSTVCVRGEIKNRASMVSLCAKVSFDFAGVCDRCAENVTKHFDIDVCHSLVTRLENEDDDENFIVVENFELDIEQLILEDLFLSLPTKFLCKDDCKGLCPSCGVNLNYKTCDCKSEIDPRWEALLNFHDNNK